MGPHRVLRSRRVPRDGIASNFLSLFCLHVWGILVEAYVFREESFDHERVREAVFLAGCFSGCEGGLKMAFFSFFSAQIVGVWLVILEKFYGVNPNILISQRVRRVTSHVCASPLPVLSKGI